MAAKTIDFDKNAAGALIFTVNGGVPRTLQNPNDLEVKPIDNGLGAVVKLTDESFRQRVFLADTVTEAGVQKSPFADQTALVTYLAGYLHT